MNPISVRGRQEAEAMPRTSMVLLRIQQHTATARATAIATSSEARIRSHDRKPMNFVAITAYVTPEHKQALKKLSAMTRISQQALLREAIDDLRQKYAQPKTPKRSQRGSE